MDWPLPPPLPLRTATTSDSYPSISRRVSFVVVDAGSGSSPKGKGASPPPLVSLRVFYYRKHVSLFDRRGPLTSRPLQLLSVFLPHITTLIHTDARVEEARLEKRVGG